MRQLFREIVQKISIASWNKQQIIGERKPHRFIVGTKMSKTVEILKSSGHIFYH